MTRTNHRAWGDRGRRDDHVRPFTVACERFPRNLPPIGVECVPEGNDGAGGLHDETLDLQVVCCEARPGGRGAGGLLPVFASSWQLALDAASGEFESSRGNR